MSVKLIKVYAEKEIANIRYFCSFECPFLYTIKQKYDYQCLLFNSVLKYILPAKKIVRCSDCGTHEIPPDESKLFECLDEDKKRFVVLKIEIDDLTCRKERLYSMTIGEEKDEERK